MVRKKQDLRISWKFNKVLPRKMSLPKEVLETLPSKYQIIGDICLVKLGYVALKYKHQIGGIILDSHPHFRTVCANHIISGMFREPKVEVIAGDKNTETIHTENGCKFKLDVAKIMWSKGNHKERTRITKVVKKNEIILDMFAGIGYFTIPLAKFSKAKKIYSIELNPTAYNYLEQNIRLNRLSNIIPIKGDCEKEIPKLKIKFDRILMGLIPSCKEYIPAALKAIKKGGVIHYHGLAKKGKEKDLLKDFGARKLKLLKTTKVKSWSPSLVHVVLDVGVL